jgi:hypothetical protein
MTDVLIPFGVEYLALTPEQFEEARRRGRELMPTASQPVATAERDEILGADGMERCTGVPASWWLEQARRQAIPHLKAGKYVRFRFGEVLEALRRDVRHADRLSASVRKLRAGSGPC